LGWTDVIKILRIFCELSLVKGRLKSVINGFAIT
jgi:hypothetical protein